MDLQKIKLYDRIIEFFMNLLAILICIAILGFIFGAGALCYKMIFSEVNCQSIQGVHK